MASIREALQLRRMKNDTNGASDTLTQTLVVGGITAIVGLIVVLSLWPTLTGSVNTATSDANTTTAQASILDLLPLVFVAGLILTVITFMIVRARSK